MRSFQACVSQPSRWSAGTPSQAGSASAISTSFCNTPFLSLTPSTSAAHAAPSGRMAAVRDLDDDSGGEAASSRGGHLAIDACKAPGPVSNPAVEALINDDLADALRCGGASRDTSGPVGDDEDGAIG